MFLFFLFKLSFLLTVKLTVIANTTLKGHVLLDGTWRKGFESAAIPSAVVVVGRRAVGAVRGEW